MKSPMAARSRSLPQVTAYWLTSARMASTAASFRSSGAGKSGKPWARLIAPCSRATRVISRMTDSVKRAALADSVSGRLPIAAQRLAGITGRQLAASGPRSRPWMRVRAARAAPAV